MSEETVKPMISERTEFGLEILEADVLSDGLKSAGFENQCVSKENS